MYQWFVINTYSGHENKVRTNLEQRVHSLGQEGAVSEIVVPTEQIIEVKDGQSIKSDRRVFPGYILVKMDLNNESWSLVRNTPGVTGFVGSPDPVPLSQQEVDRILHTAPAEKPRAQAQFSAGDTVKVVAGPLSDFSGVVAEVNSDQSKLKVLVSIFGRETPAELSFDQVKRV